MHEITARVLEALPNAKRSGTGWSAKCPSHDDHNPSLTVTEGDKGLLIRCHKGCQLTDILSALTIAPPLAPADLFWERAQRWERKASTTPEATYQYLDESGVLLYEVLRLPGKHFRQRKPNGRGGWLWKLGDVRRVLYRLPALVREDARRVAWIVEGEKDVHALESIGLLATTNAQGADAWRDEYGEWLTKRGGPICVAGDKDEAGERHDLKVGHSLARAGFKGTLKRVLWPGDGVKDAADWVAAGGTKDAAKALWDAAPTWNLDAAALPPDNEPGCSFRVGRRVVYGGEPPTYELEIDRHMVTFRLEDVLSPKAFRKRVLRTLPQKLVSVPGSAAKWDDLVRNWIAGPNTEKRHAPAEAREGEYVAEQVKEAVESLAYGEDAEDLDRGRAIELQGKRLFKTKAVALALKRADVVLGRNELCRRLEASGFVGGNHRIDGRQVWAWMGDLPEAKPVDAAGNNGNVVNPDDDGR